MNSTLMFVVDRLGAGHLGPYGATWLETPELDRLAAQSLLCEFALADSADLSRSYRSYWQGCHAAGADGLQRAALPELLAQQSCPTVLLTDDPEVAELPWAAAFDQRLTVPTEPVTRAAEAVDQTGLARLTGAVLEWLEGRKEPFFLWVHARGMSGPWDAPLELRNQFADEDDPLPPEDVEPPRRTLPDQFDPDEVLGYMHAYAGQLVLLDACLGALLDALENHPLRDSTAFCLTSPRGYPLGEHRQVGPDAELLFGEQVQVPCFWRSPDGRSATLRSHVLVQPHDLFATLADWHQLPAADSDGISLLRVISAEWGESEGSAIRHVACAVAERARAIRTPAWFLIAAEDRPARLYAKPDDRWEANEVADRRPDLVVRLLELLDDFQQAAQNNRISEIAPLANELLQQD